MRNDKVAYDGRQILPFCHLHTLGNMTYNNARTLLVRHIVVRIYTSLILGKEYWVYHLAYVVIQGAGTHKQRIGSYLVGYFCRKVTHGDRVLERSRSYL